MLIVFLSYVAVYFINIAADLDGWLCMVIVTVLLAAVSRYLGIDRKSAFLFGVLFYSINNLSSLTVVSVSFYTDKYLVQGAEGVERILQNTALNFCLVELLRLILFSAMLYTVGRQIRKCRMELHIRELCYLLLTPLTGILFGNIIFRILLVVSDNLVMKNHLTNIKGLFESGNLGEMEQYINKMDESMDVFELAIKTGNPVTDVIVNDKQKAAEKQGIRFQSGFIYPKSERYNAYDIGIAGV